MLTVFCKQVEMQHNRREAEITAKEFEMACIADENARLAVGCVVPIAVFCILCALLSLCVCACSLVCVVRTRASMRVVMVERARMVIHVSLPESIRTPSMIFLHDADAK